MQGPQLSPDGHWWWDGRAWQPVQAPPPQPERPPTEQKPEWLDQAPTGVEPGQGAAAPKAAQAMVEPPAPVPLWQQRAPRSGTSPVIYVAAALLIAVIAIGGMLVRSQLLATPSSTANTEPSPTSLLSDYERAQRFLNVDVGPSLTETTQALPAVQSSCTSALPPSCKDALLKLDKAMVDVEDAMNQNHRDIPSCVGPQVDQFKSDWTGMEQGVSLAIQGYQVNSRDLTVQGMQKFASIAQFMQNDINRINTAEQTCKK